jgi:hypothetical protein
LRELRRDPSVPVEIMCSHDVVEFERLAGRPHDVPARATITPIPAWSAMPRPI